MRHKSHVIVTGGAGFIGSHIAARLVSRGDRVTVLDDLSTGRIANVPRGAEFMKLDLGLQKSFAKLANIECDAVLHLAGQSSGEASFLDPFLDLRSHVMSTFWLLEWCKKKGVRRFLYASSMSVYGDPSYLPVDENHPLRPKTFYGAGKAAAEAYIRLYQSLGFNTTIFRLFSVYGPGQNLANKMQGMVSIYLSFILEGVPILVKGSKDRFRDFIYVGDVVDVWLAAMDDSASHGKTYNIAGGKRTTVGDLVGALKAAFRSPNYPVEYKGGTPGDQFGVFADISLVKNDLKWRPKTDLKTGLRKMLMFERRRQKSG